MSDPRLDSKPICQHFADDLTSLVERYYDQGLTVAEALGCLSLCQHEVVALAKRVADDEPEDDEPEDDEP